mgnify:CR=1 FL=1|nr:MAG TPA: hypothetical protein [Caudoviricetes sp.]
MGATGRQRYAGAQTHGNPVQNLAVVNPRLGTVPVPVGVRLPRSIGQISPRCFSQMILYVAKI